MKRYLFLGYFLLPFIFVSLVFAWTFWGHTKEELVTLPVESTYTPSAMIGGTKYSDILINQSFQGDCGEPYGPPIDGMCSNPSVKNTCAAGNFSDVDDTATDFIWDCLTNDPFRGYDTLGCSVPKSTPDLVADTPSTSGQVSVNIPQTFTATITNSGTGPTGGGFHNYFQISTGPGQTGTVIAKLGTNVATSLSEYGGTDFTSITYTFTQGGIYYIRACADGTDSSTEESDEMNNCSGDLYVEVLNDGVCPTTLLTENECAAGALVDTTDTTTQFLWECASIDNLGMTGYCAMDKPDLDLTGVGPSPTTASLNIPQIFTATFSKTNGQPFFNFFQVSTDPTMLDGLLITDIPQTDMIYLGDGGSVTTTTSHQFTATGTYYIRACADMSDRNSTGSIDEPNEMNNCGDIVTVTVTDTPIDGTCSSPLMANTCATGNFVAGTPSATQYLWDCEGTGGGATVSCTLDKPDIDLFGVAPSPTTATLGISQTFTATFPNINSPIKGSFQNTLQIATDINMMGTDIYTSMDALDVGEFGNMTASHTFTEGGTYYLRVCADANNTIQESNEDNNCGDIVTISIPVDGECSMAREKNKCAVGSVINESSDTTGFYWDCEGVGGGATVSCSIYKPDLTASAPSPDTASNAITQIFSATISNANSRADGAFDNYFEIDGGTVTEVTTPIGPLAAGGTETVTISHTFTTAGPHSIRVCVDSYNVIDESDENNCGPATTVNVADHVPCTVGALCNNYVFGECYFGVSTPVYDQLDGSGFIDYNNPSQVQWACISYDDSYNGSNGGYGSMADDEDICTFTAPPPECDLVNKGECLVGTSSVTPPVVPFTDAPDGFGGNIRTYAWTCTSPGALPDETIACELEVLGDFCGDVLMTAGQECCDAQILVGDQTCCTPGIAVNPDAIDEGKTLGKLVGSGEDVCNNAGGMPDSCFYRRTCSDAAGNDAANTETGDPTGGPDYKECNYEMVCADAIVHSCTADKPNNNCQDECHPNIDPLPSFCTFPPGTLGTCDTTFNTCLTGGPFSIPPNTTTWWCLGADNTSGLDDEMCLLSDLTAGNASPATAKVDVSQTFTATISNANSPTGVGFDNFFQIWPLPDMTGEPGDKPATAMGALAAGASDDTTTSHTFTEVGAYYVRVCADKTDSNSAGVISESNEDNNCSLVLTTVLVTDDIIDGVCSDPLVENTCFSGTPVNTADNAVQLLWNCDGINGGTDASCAIDRPNLTAGAPSPAIASLNIAQTFTSIISNANTSPTGAGFDNYFKISTSPDMTGAVSKTPTAMGALAAGDQDVTTTSHTFTAVGTYYIQACADSGGVITESNEGDNCGAIVTVTVIDGSIDGVCSDPLVVNTCIAGNMVGLTDTTWRCDGINGGTDASCSLDAPNLTASSPSPTTANLGIAQTFTAIISNANTSPTGGGFDNFFQISTSSDMTTDLIDLDPIPMGALAAGGSARTATSYTFTAAGTYYIRVCADKSDRNSVGVIGESNEDDNCSTAVTTVTVIDASVNGECSNPLVEDTCNEGNLFPLDDTATELLWRCDGINGGTDASCALGKPDLTAGAPSPTTATVNTAKTFTATISNANSTTGVGFYNYFQISTEPNMTGTVINKSPTLMGALAAGASDDTTTSHTFTAAGTYYIRACADTNDDVDESDEDNCGPETTVTVTDTASDLTAGAPSPTITTLNTAQTFIATITNVNTVTTGAAFNNFFQVTNVSGYDPDVPSPDLTKIDDKPSTAMGTLAGGASDDTSTSHTFTVAGTYYIRVCADKTDRNTTNLNDDVDESNENNNCGAWTLVTVIAGCPEGETYVIGATTPDKCCTADEIFNNDFNCGTGDPGTCNEDGICDANEGCTCPDCEGPLPLWENNKCVDTLICDMVIRGDGACCPNGTTWDTVTNTCVGTAPDLTAAALTPTTATVDAAQTFTATISNANTVTTGVGFNNFFQVTNVSGYNPDVPSPDLTKIDDKPSTAMGVLAAGASANTTTSHTFTAAGTYYIRVCADKTDRDTTNLTDSVDESNENNNCSTWTAVTVSNGCPSGETYVDDSLQPDKCCTDAERENNILQCGNPPICNEDGICDANEGCTCPDCAGVLPPAENNKCEDTLICDMVIPGDGYCCPAGTIWNTATNTCDLDPNKPDLTAGAPSPGVAQTMINVAQIFDTSISNANTVTTGAGFNNFFQVTTDIADINQYTDQQPPIPMNALAAGASDTMTTSYTFVAAGTYYVRACTDKDDRNSLGVIDESNENNNCGDWTTVEVLDPTLPNLTAVAPTPTTATVDAAQTFIATISNANTVTTAVGFNNFFQVTDTPNIDPETNPAVIDDKTSTAMGALAAGASDNTSTSHTFTAAGTYYIRACADKTDRNSVGVIAESNENNNCSAWTLVTVSNGCPEGETYVADSLQPDKCCTALERANDILQCGNTPICNEDGICDANEGCTCPDCLGSGVDASCDPGLECDIVIPRDGACCPAGTKWDTLNNICTFNLSASPMRGGKWDAVNNQWLIGRNAVDLQRLFADVINESSIAKIEDIPYIFQFTAGGIDGSGNAIGTVEQVPPTKTLTGIGSSATVTVDIDYLFNTVGTYHFRMCANKSSATEFGVTYPLESDPDDNCGAWTQFKVANQLVATFDCDGVPATLDQYNYFVFSPFRASDLTVPCINPGFEIARWCTDSGLDLSTCECVTCSRNIAEDTTYYPYWVSTAQLSVTYNKNPAEATGSPPIDATLYDPLQTVTVLGKNTLLNTGFIFSSWNTLANASGVSYRPGARFNILNNVNLYSQWGDVASLDGCFTDSNRSDVNLSNYSADLITRLNSATNLGYILSDPTRSDQTKTFKTRLAGNINKYITSRYCPTSISTGTIWDAATSDTAQIDPLFGDCNGNNTPNPNGYYYYTGAGANRLLTVNGLTGVSLLQDDEIIEPTVLYVVGADVYIQENIRYANTDTSPSLVIIVQKDSANQGGNIYINPDVTHIDGTLIADGALLNGTPGSTLNWITHLQELSNPLVINGRLLTYNTRGGSLKVESGNLVPIVTPELGSCSNGVSIGPCDIITAAVQDLERFRRIIPITASDTCSLYVTNSVPARKPDILTTLPE